MYGLKTKGKDRKSEMHAKKPTKFMTNAEMLAGRLAKKCVGGHRHIILSSGRPKAAESYPEDLCKEVIRGLRDQMGIDGRLHKTGIGSVFAIEGIGNDFL